MEERNIVISERVVGLLRRMPAFRDMDETALRELFAGEGLIRFREYRAGETIIREGEQDRWVYHLVSGRARVLSQEAEVAVLSRYGDIFGEMGPLRGRPRNATVVAVADVTCFAVDLSLLDRLPAEDRQRKTKLLEAVFNDVVHERLARANDDASALRRDLLMAESAMAGLTDRVRELERRVAELTRENQALRRGRTGRAGEDAGRGGGDAG